MQIVFKQLFRSRPFIAMVITVVAVVAAYMVGIEFYAKQNGDVGWLNIVLVSISSFLSIVSVGFSQYVVLKYKSKQIFIIYSHKDVAVARQVAKLLRSKGYEPWINYEQISVGQNWKESISKGIASSSVALLLVSRNLDVNSEYINGEISAAMSQLKSRSHSISPVIPVLIDDTQVPDVLGPVQGVSLANKKWVSLLDDGLQKILRSS